MIRGTQLALAAALFAVAAPADGCTVIQSGVGQNAVAHGETAGIKPE